MYKHPTKERTVGYTTTVDADARPLLEPTGTPVQWFERDTGESFIDYHDLSTLEEAEPWWKDRYHEWPDEGDVVTIRQDSRNQAIPEEALAIVLESNEFFLRLQFSDYEDRTSEWSGPWRRYQLTHGDPASDVYSKDEDGRWKYGDPDYDAFDGEEYTYWRDEDVEFRRTFICDGCDCIEDTEDSWYYGDQDYSYKGVVQNETGEVCRGCLESDYYALESIYAHGEEQFDFHMHRYQSTGDGDGLGDRLYDFVCHMKDWEEKSIADGWIQLPDEEDDMEGIANLLDKQQQTHRPKPTWFVLGVVKHGRWLSKLAAIEEKYKRGKWSCSYWLLWIIWWVHREYYLYREFMRQHAKCKPYNTYVSSYKPSYWERLHSLLSSWLEKRYNRRDLAYKRQVNYADYTARPWLEDRRPKITVLHWDDRWYVHEEELLPLTNWLIENEFDFVSILGKLPELDQLLAGTKAEYQEAVKEAYRGVAALQDETFTVSTCTFEQVVNWGACEAARSHFRDVRKFKLGTVCSARDILDDPTLSASTKVEWFYWLIVSTDPGLEETLRVKRRKWHRSIDWLKKVITVSQE